MLRRFLILLLVLLPAPAMAQSFEQSFADLAPERQSREERSLEGQQLEGSWALRIDGAIIFRFDLAESGEGWSGVWSRPTSFASDGNRFGNLTGPTDRVDSSETRTIGEWIELTFPDERPGAVPDIFRFRQTEPDRVEMIYVDTGLAPYTLERVAEDALLGPWEAGKVYARDGAPPAPSASPRPRPGASQPRGEVQGPVFEGR